MKESGSYDLRVESKSESEELARLENQVDLAWFKELELLKNVGLGSASDLLEIGCGPGYYTRKLKLEFPELEIHAIDPNNDLLDVAKMSFDALVDNTIHFSEGSVYDIDFEDKSFDFVIARYVFQHLDKPDAALNEIYRILKPGGTVAIIDIDAGMLGIFEPYDYSLEPIYRKHSMLQSQKGGDRLIGRKLWGMLSAAGFYNPNLQSYVYHSNEYGMKAFIPQISPDRYFPLLEQGVLNESEYQQLQRSFERFIRNENAFVMMVGFFATGQRQNSQII